MLRYRTHAKAGNAQPSGVSAIIAVPGQSRAPSHFRADINALRAFSVTAVVLFHFGIRPFGGGFVGVDIFFVISGYLMSRIIEARLSSNDFSLVDFYFERTRRLVPALLCLCAAMAIVSLVALDPLTARTTSRDTLAALLFVSNIRFAFEDGYFAATTGTKWLLQTWTLSVEWQFYLLFPLFLSALHMRTKLWQSRLWQSRWQICIVLAAGSFLAAATIGLRSPTTLRMSFFLLPARAWELLAGACIAFAPRRAASIARRRMLLAISLAIILASLLVITPQMPWPSAWTLLPVIGAAGVLAADAGRVRLFEIAPVQNLGIWSYSIYLWHWPVWVGLHYFLGTLSTAQLVAGLAASVLLGACSYELAETRLRTLLFGSGRRLRWRDFFKPPSRLMLAGVAALCCIGIGTDGLERMRMARFDTATMTTLADYRAAQSDWAGLGACPNGSSALMGGRICQLGARDRHDIAVIGDSHAEEILARYMRPGDLPGDQGMSVLFSDGCLPVPGAVMRNPGLHCDSFARAAYAYIEREHFRRVVVISMWQGYFSGSATNANGVPQGSLYCFDNGRGCHPPGDMAEYRATADDVFARLGRQIAELRAQGADVRLLGVDLDLRDSSAQQLYQQTFATHAPVMASPVVQARYVAANGLAFDGVNEAARIGKATLIQPTDYLCRDGTCSFYDHDAFVFKDNNHIRASIIRRPRYDYIDTLLFATATDIAHPAAELHAR